MAYTSATLVPLQTGYLENTQTLWLYTTADSEATVKGANYINDALVRGVKKGDLVFVIAPTTPAAFILQVAANPTASGVAIGATVVVT
jgi:hypothetical protein